MQNPEPSREELIRQIADIVGKAAPQRSRGKRLLSILVSTIIRVACVSYAFYLSSLFLEKFDNGYERPHQQTVSNIEFLLFGLVLVFFLYLVFRQVYRDRLVPIMEMLKRMMVRLGVIVVTFLFWTAVFSLFRYSGGDSFWLIIASLFIINSGYDFRLGPRPPRPALKS